MIAPADANDGPLSREEIDALFNRHAGKFRQLAAARVPQALRHLVDPDDVLQDVLVDLYEKGQTARGIESLEKWLAKALQYKMIHIVRVLRTQRRAENRRAALSGSAFMSLLGAISARMRSPSSECAAREKIADVRQAVADLPSEERVVVSLHLEEPSQQKLAEQTRKSPAAVNGTLFRGKRRLGWTLRRHRER